jgi:hypothetical protein
VTALDACQLLNKKYSVQTTPHSSLSSSVVHHWQNLQCDQLLQQASQHGGVQTSALPGEAQAQLQEPIKQAPEHTLVGDIKDTFLTAVKDVSEAVISAEHKIIDTVEHQLHPTATVEADLESEDLTESELECMNMQKEYHVVPGSSWGNLPDELQK